MGAITFLRVSLKTVTRKVLYKVHTEYNKVHIFMQDVTQWSSKVKVLKTQMSVCFYKLKHDPNCLLANTQPPCRTNLQESLLLVK